MPLWLKSKLHLPREMRKGLQGKYKKRFVFTDHAGGEPLVLPFSEVKAVLMQVGNKLQIRTDADNYQITPTLHSTNMWKYFIDRHLKAWRRASGSSGS